MGLVNRLYTWAARRTIKSAEINQEINQILGILNGGIENNNVRMNAGIRQDQGKVILDYDEIRTNLESQPGTLDGSVLIDGTVSLDAMEYAENTLAAVGMFTNTDPGSFPWTVPAGTFKQFMVVFYGACVEITGSDDTNSRIIQLNADSTALTAAQLGQLTQKISESGDAFTSKLAGMAMCYIQMSQATNDYAAAIPQLVIAQDHDFDITEANSATLTQKQIHIFGR